MKARVLLVLVLFISITSQAQDNYREFDVNDSTIHALNNDTLIIANKYVLFIKRPGGIDTLRNFYNGNPDFFIRDVDIFQDRSIYVVHGSRYISNITETHRGWNLGQSWTQDTSYYPISRVLVNNGAVVFHNSVNQIQELAEDTLMIFHSYYQSAIIYSTDNGQNWNTWFDQTPAHFHGIFRCDSLWYVWGLEGDAFSASMFELNNTDFLNTSFQPPPCFQGGQTNCIYAMNSLPRFDQYLFFGDYLDSACFATNHLEYATESGISIYPNPGSGQIIISTKWDEIPSVSLINSIGKPIEINYRQSGNEIILDLKGIPRGNYILKLANSKRHLTKRISIQ